LFVAGANFVETVFLTAQIAYFLKRCFDNFRIQPTAMPFHRRFVQHESKNTLASFNDLACFHVATSSSEKIPQRQNNIPYDLY
jgi:hypothetical protein